MARSVPHLRWAQSQENGPVRVPRRCENHHSEDLQVVNLNKEKCGEALDPSPGSMAQTKPRK